MMYDNFPNPFLFKIGEFFRFLYSFSFDLFLFLFFFLCIAEYKKARSELKKRSTDTLRLQKKARKSGKADDLQKALLEVSEKKTILEEAEKKAVRDALIEERSRYCLFVALLKPVVVSNFIYFGRGQKNNMYYVII